MVPYFLQLNWLLPTEQIEDTWCRESRHERRRATNAYIWRESHFLLSQPVRL